MSEEALISAIKRGHLNAVKDIINNNEINFNDELILHSILEKGDTRIADYFVSKKLYPLHMIFTNENLIKTITDGNHKLFVYLIENYPVAFSMSIKDIYLKAAECGRIKILKYLFDKKRVTVATEDRALSLAANQGHERVVSYLLFQGANPNDNEGWPIIYAAKHGHYNVVKELIKHGANVHVKNNLAKKASGCYPNIIKLLEGGVMFNE